MKTDQLWINVPHAVVLEVTRNLDAVLALTGDALVLLVIKANHLVSDFMVIPLDTGADEEIRREALRKFHEVKGTGRGDKHSHYLRGLERVHGRLLQG